MTTPDGHHLLASFACVRSSQPFSHTVELRITSQSLPIVLRHVITYMNPQQHELHNFPRRATRLSWRTKTETLRRPRDRTGPHPLRSIAKMGDPQAGIIVSKTGHSLWHSRVSYFRTSSRMTRHQSCGRRIYKPMTSWTVRGGEYIKDFGG